MRLGSAGATVCVMGLTDRDMYQSVVGEAHAETLKETTIMGAVYRRAFAKESAAFNATLLADVGMIQCLSENLAWIGQIRNLIMCQTFKTQQGWFIAAFSSMAKLAGGFIGKQSEQACLHVEGASQEHQP